MVVDFNNSNAKVVAPIKLAHVVLRTSQIEKMGDFYVTFLGGAYALKVKGLYFITYDDEHHRLGLIEMPNLNRSNRSISGLEHIAFTFATLPELLLAYRQRKAKGIVPTWCTNHGPTTSIYYTDPDGNMVETQYDNFDTVQEANDFMTSESYMTNPIGVDFDPEDLIKRLEAGESVDKLAQRPDSGPRGVEDIAFLQAEMAQLAQEAH